MSQDWDVLEFVTRFQDGEFDGQLVEAIDQLSPEQLVDLERFLATQAHGPLGIIDLKRSGSA